MTENLALGAAFNSHEIFRLFRKIDIADSNFSCYQLSLVMKTAKRLRVKPIHISGKLRQKLIDYTNQGKQYC